MNNVHHSSGGHDEFLACAEAAARAAGQHALDNLRRRNEAVAISAHDVKLKLDIECQAIAENVVRTRFPDHVVFGEESDTVKDITGAPFTWIIDPIDGTVNYSHGLPLWCCSVALLERGRTIAGAVFAPVMDECYTACVGKQAYCNGRPIAVSETQRLEQAVIATGIDKTSRDISESMNFLEKLTKRVQRPRILGSAALDICHVACGKTDGYYESGIYLWDVAAGGLIVEQAGGRSEILGRTSELMIGFMAVNAFIHDEFRELIVASR